MVFIYKPFFLLFLSKKHFYRKKLIKTKSTIFYFIYIKKSWKNLREIHQIKGKKKLSKKTIY